MKAALVAVQLVVDDEVLASGDAYRAHLEASIARALDGAGAADHTLVVLPELAGHLAMFALSPPAAHRAKTLPAALAAGAMRRPLEVLRGVATTRVLDPRHAILAALAPDAERFWRGVCGPLARAKRVHLVAGSHIRLGANGELTSSSFLFAPDGRLLATTNKVNLVPAIEDGAPSALGLARGDAEKLPIVETPFGKVATLIGYDAAREPLTELERFVVMGPRIAKRGGVTVVANPEADRAGVPGHREGIAAALREMPFARFAVTAHLGGAVLDMSFEGTSEILERAATGVTQLVRGELARAVVEVA
ncbi:MAG: nitrilase-related carbon-nitrogen hydrolase [Kofleriaceae bacterium]